MQRLRDDEGAVAVLVAVVITAMLGFGAVVIDVGQLYAERRQLQNGADAAALALAMDCPGPTGCSTDTSASGPAGRKGNQNANDGSATITQICGTTVSPCPSPPGPGPWDWDCRPVPGALASANYVQVRTETRQGGGNLVPPVLAQVLPGNSGSTVRACARASWGNPTGLTSQLPLTISLCEFQQYTAAGLAPPPPYTGGYPSERIIYFHNNTDDAPPCAAGPSGADLPGGFGWLSTAEDCVATSDTSGFVPASTGVPPPSSCSNAELLAMRGQIINVPVFDVTNDLNGSNGAYRIRGYAAFFLTGYRFPSAQASSLVTGSLPCRGSDHCISGFFTTDPSPVGGTIGPGPNMGTTVVQMSG